MVLGRSCSNTPRVRLSARLCGVAAPRGAERPWKALRARSWAGGDPNREIRPPRPRAAKHHHVPSKDTQRFEPNLSELFTLVVTRPRGVGPFRPSPIR